MKYCPWCGQLLELKMLDLGHKFKHVCSRCGWKIREFPKPEPESEPIKEKEKIIEIKEREIPGTNPRPAWPFILGAVVLIAIIIALIKIFLV